MTNEADAVAEENGVFPWDTAFYSEGSARCSHDPECVYLPVCTRARPGGGYDYFCEIHRPVKGLKGRASTIAFESE